MTPLNAKNDRDVLSGKLSFHRYTIAGLLGLSSVLGVGMVWQTMHSTVVLVPPEIRRQYEVGANFADRDYLADMANYVLSTVLTVTPDSVDHNNAVILKMTDPDGYASLKSDLDAAALRLKRDRVTTLWSWRTEKVFSRDKKVEVTGRLKTFISDVLTSERDKTFLVEFIINSSGRLYVSKVKELVKADLARPAHQSAS